MTDTTHTLIDVSEAPLIDARAGRWERLKARVFAERYDAQVEAGAVPAPGGALAVHLQRLASPTEHAILARALRQVQHDARVAFWPMTARIPVHRHEVIANDDLIDEIVTALTDGRPLRLRGVARLRLLLSDGTGPLYVPRRGSLRAAMRGVLAAF